MHEDIKDLVKGYKFGIDVAFTASYKGKLNNAIHAAFVSLPEETSSNNVVVDVQAEAVVE